ncbi:MAG: 16S rRNA (guanine(527)-N(7))-methyltransferase RsmG [Marinilabiliales bacterium]|nr:MAG: 16S rRNA (guanine(527)-N(7))-methyltransferase RsmG [Marinilabiliales bacterium]
MELINKYFPELDAKKLERFEALMPLYEDWNSKINVISRKDFEHFYERHVLHSLAIAKFHPFEAGMRIMDVGTGGGFPGIPLAIMFPETEFTLVDSIGKKIKVVKGVAEALGLQNVKAFHERAEKMRGKWNVVVSRAVTNLPDFYRWVENKLKQYKDFPSVLYLKGGDIEEELDQLPCASFVQDLTKHFSEDFFETKKLVSLYI